MRNHRSDRQGESAEELKGRVEEAMREMIACHQVKTGGIGRAVLERLAGR